MSSSLHATWRTLRAAILVLCVGLPLLSLANPAWAQGAASGYELALVGNSRVVEGRAARFRGIAYRVRGLAKLEAIAGARVRARYVAGLKQARAWQEVRADRSGFFQIDVPVPSGRKGSARVEVALGKGDEERLFAFPIDFAAPFLLDLQTDRRLYEPGETIHAWARVRDVESRQPLVDEDITLSFTGTGAFGRTHKSGASGVVSSKVVIPKEAKEGNYVVIAKVGGREFRQALEVGTRSYERIFAEIKVSKAVASPHENVAITVKVTTASGALVRNADVVLKLDKSESRGRTNGQGITRIHMRAPAYMSHSTGSVAIVAEVRHAAHGATKAFSRLRLAVPLTLKVEAVPSNGALVPQLPGLLYIRLSSGDGKPAALGTPMEVRGAAIPGGVASGKTDAHGFVTIKTRLPRGAATGGDEATTMVIVHVGGAAPRTASIEVAVARKAELVPHVNKAVVAPGETISIRLERRASAATKPAIVELMSSQGLIEALKLPAGVNQVKMKVPPDILGVLTVRARPLQQKSVAEGTGAVDAFLVRPPVPSFPTLKASKEVYSVSGTATLTLSTAPGAGKSWAAILVRDLAAHSGELPFQFHFLQRAFARAILDPKLKSANTLLRTALADYLYVDGVPQKAPELLNELGQEGEEGYDLGHSRERGMLRDPFPLGEELSRRGVGSIMRELEERLSDALDDGTLSEVATRSGTRSDFKKGILAEFDEHPLSLGQGKLTLAMLTASDSSFRYDNVGRRVARRRLIELLVALSVYLDPGDDASPQQRAAAREPSDRWLPRMVERGIIGSEQLADPWGNSFTLRRSSKPALAIAIEAANLELVSPGPDGKLGTRDDISDPFARAIPTGTPYAVASGEDKLMETLARLSPGAEVLKRLLQAYDRITAEVAEEEIGDAVSASVSEGWGTIGTGSYGTVGSGSGGGYGYGSGKGGLAGRSARPPHVRIGSASARGGVSGFARVIRERFPSTLMFTPVMEVDPSGSTEISIPLSDAVTTYLVEVVVWSADGWTWSTDTKIRVDKETVIDSPVPSYATVGDKLRLPLRIGNRSNKDQILDVSIFAPGKLETPLATRKGVRAPAKDTAVQMVDVQLDKAMKGSITVGVQSAQGVPLDAVRRPITVQHPTRRVRRRYDFLAGAAQAGTNASALRFTVHERATQREGSQVHIRVGPGLFAVAPGRAETRWLSAWARRGETAASRRRLTPGNTELKAAFLVGSSWSTREVSDDFLARTLRDVTASLDQIGKQDDRKVRLQLQVRTLLWLAPATRAIHTRQGLKKDLEGLLRKLRKDVHSSVAMVSGDPHIWAMSAAALALTAPAKSKNKLVRELVSRVRRHQLYVGSHTWVATKEGVHETSAFLALAELKIGERKRALALLRTLAKLALSDRSLNAWTQALAKFTAQEASPKGAPSQVSLVVDGVKTRVDLESGVGRVPAPSLGRPGAHTITVDDKAASSALYYLEASTEHGLPWDLVPERPGSFISRLEGEIGAVGRPAKLTLVVRNRSPRAIAHPIVEVSLPAGAELDEEAKKVLRRYTRGDSEAARGTLRLSLAGLPPGGKRKIPLTLRWSLGGKLQGLGIASYPEGRPDDISIQKPRTLSIPSAQVTP